MIKWLKQMLLLNAVLFATWVWRKRHA